MPQVFIRPQAEEDIKEIWFYIAVESGYPQNGDSFIESICEKFKKKEFISGKSAVGPDWLKEAQRDSRWSGRRMENRKRKSWSGDVERGLQTGTEGNYHKNGRARRWEDVLVGVRWMVGVER